MDLVPVTAKYKLAFLMFLIATGITSAEAIPYQIRPRRLKPPGPHS